MSDSTKFLGVFNSSIQLVVIFTVFLICCCYFEINVNIFFFSSRDSYLHHLFKEETEDKIDNVQ